jgi:hypothetical protein
MTSVGCVVCLNENCQCNREPQAEHYNCPRCGVFDVVGTARRILPERLQKKIIDRSALSHVIRKAQTSNHNFQIYEEDLPRYRDALRVGKPREIADNLILWIGSNQSSPDSFAMSDLFSLAATVASVVSGSGEATFYWIVDYLKKENWIEEHPSPPHGRVGFKLQIAGWDRYDELQHANVASRVAFMAMKFGDAILDRVLQECFKPSAFRAGFDLKALNETQPAGLIDNQIRAAIRRARFVIADLTHDNNGAYFEAGFAEGIGLPVIYTCERQKFADKKTHFDTNHMVTIPWHADALSEAGSALTATIRATFPEQANKED